MYQDDHQNGVDKVEEEGHPKGSEPLTVFGSTLELYTCMVKCKSWVKEIPPTKKNNCQFHICNESVPKNMLFKDGCTKWSKKGSSNLSVTMNGRCVAIRKSTYNLLADEQYQKIIYKLNDKYLVQYLGKYVGETIFQKISPIRAAQLILECKSDTCSSIKNQNNCYYIVNDELDTNCIGCIWRYKSVLKTEAFVDDATQCVFTMAALQLGHEGQMYVVTTSEYSADCKGIQT